MATVDNFISAIEKEVNDYSKQTLADIEKTLDETADKILAYIKSNTKRSGRSGALADDFVKEDSGTGITKTITIYAKSKGSITHLIEFGFTHKSGQYVGARPFLRPAFDELSPKMIEDIKRIISGK